MLKIHKFARRTFYVDAVRVSEANIEEVKEWCDGTIETDATGHTYIGVKVLRALTDRQGQAFIGDWVLYSGTSFKVYTPKAFDKSFEKVKYLTKEQADQAGIKPPHEPRPEGEKKSAKKSSKRPPRVGSVGKAMEDAQAKAREGMAKMGQAIRKQEDHRSSETGQFVTEEEAEANPSTTVKETREIKPDLEEVDIAPGVTAAMEAQPTAVVPSQDSTIAGVPIAEHNTLAEEAEAVDEVLSPGEITVNNEVVDVATGDTTGLISDDVRGKTKADIEADKLIAEADALRGKSES